MKVLTLLCGLFLVFAIPMSCFSQQGEIYLTGTWTAPGDDSTDGTASIYDMRYSTDQDSLINYWSGCAEVGNLPIPDTSGTSQSVTDTLVVKVGVTYYVAIKAADEVPNWSNLSNFETFIREDDIPPSVPIITNMQFTW
jgi:hypothetical protein